MLALQINNQWAVLSEDQSVTIEENSPVWGEGNTFSLPFELDVEANRHILGNSDQLTGMSVYDVLEGQSATLYVMGIPLFYGKLSLEDEVEIENGTVEVSLISSRLTFDDMIEGMNCQDVEMTEKIVLGEKYNNYVGETKLEYTGGGQEFFEAIQGVFPNAFMRMRNNEASTVNLSNAYPTSKYCNIRICSSFPEEQEGSEKGPEKEISKVDTGSEKGYKTRIGLLKEGRYMVLDADRSLSAPCFYVLYFMECLFSKLSIAFDFKDLYSEEDICRLAFVNTRCKFDEVFNGKAESIIFNKGYNGSDFGKYKAMQIVPTDRELDYPLAYWKGDAFFTFRTLPAFDYSGQIVITSYINDCIANSKNFPNSDVSSVVESLENAFGIRLLFNRQNNKVVLKYVRDILKDTSSIGIKAEVLSVHKAENSTKGFVLKYNGDDEDTSFNYNEWGNTVLFGNKEDSINGYNMLQTKITPFDKTCYIDVRNGNAYRIKVDEDAEDADSLNPSLFEVGMFNPVKYGDCTNEDNVHEVSIPFSPVILNDTEWAVRKEKLASLVEMKGEISDEDGKNTEQSFAVFVDVETKYPSLIPEVKSGTFKEYDNSSPFVSSCSNLSFTYVDSQMFDEKSHKASKLTDKESYYPWNKTFVEYLDNDSPIQTFDAGLTLGIMRGPGNTSGVQDYDEDYDGEGGSKYVSVPTNYAFHSDTVDNYARVFDYDGGGNYTGVDTSKRFSLKLRAEKPTVEGAKKDVPVWPGDYHQITQSYAAGRGLFDKFYTEYAYFVTHRKIAKLTLRMEIADLVNIDWTKRYRIGSFIGFINSYSYTVDSQGISEVQMELYYI